MIVAANPLIFDRSQRGDRLLLCLRRPGQYSTEDCVYVVLFHVGHCTISTVFRTAPPATERGRMHRSEDHITSSSAEPLLRNNSVAFASSASASLPMTLRPAYVEPVSILLITTRSTPAFSARRTCVSPLAPRSRRILVAKIGRKSICLLRTDCRSLTTTSTEQVNCGSPTGTGT